MTHSPNPAQCCSAVSPCSWQRHHGMDSACPTCQAAAQPANPAQGVPDAQIKHMVDRFLTWKLPVNFRPDAGISFKAEFNENSAWPMKHEPSGTNLLDATQADEMVRYMIEGLPAAIGVGGQAVAVKPLEWFNNWGTIKAETSIGHYFIENRRDGGFDCRLENVWNVWASSSETAKAAAQADYERRILSAFAHPSPAIPVKEVERVLERTSATVKRYRRAGLGDDVFHSDLCETDAAIDALLSRLRAGPQEAGDECMWTDKPCTCGGGPCEQVDFGASPKETSAAAHLEKTEKAGPQEGWWPIETAPEDGSQIDLWCRSPGISGGGYARIPDCWFSCGRWWRYDENGDDQCRERVHNATHWMPRPAAPSPEAKGGDRG